MSIDYAMPLTAYHAAEAISCSKLKRFQECRFDAEFLKQEHKTTEAFAIGQALEDALQRGRDEATATLVAAPVWGKKADTIEKNLAAASQLVDAMAEACERHPLMANIRKHGVQQVTFRRSFRGATLQCRPDWWFPNGIDGMSDPCCVDLKTTENVSEFSDNAIKFRYHWQDWLSGEIVRKALSEENGVPVEEIPAIRTHFLVVDKHELGPVCQLWQLPLEYLQLARHELVGTDEAPGLLVRLAHCMAHKQWDGPANQVMAKAPRWLERIFS